MISSGFIVGGLCLCGEQDTMLRAPLISLQTSFSRFKTFLKHFSSAKEHKGVVVIKTNKQTKNCVCRVPKIRPVHACKK